MRNRLLLVLSILFTFLSSEAQNFYVNEDFNSGRNLPAGWTVTTLSGSVNWKITDDGSNAQANVPPGTFAGESGLNNIDGTFFAVFDDDSLGAPSTNNTAAIVTPVFDNSAAVRTDLSFDYNFKKNTLVAGSVDSFYVQVFDGSNWVSVFSVTSDDCGYYTGSPCTLNGFPSAIIDITAYANANCQVRFVYFDGNDWSFYVGVDNVQISSPVANDVRVAQVIYPISDCGLTGVEYAQLMVVNQGTVPASNFEVKLDIDNGAQLVIDTIVPTILGGDTLIYTFSNPADFSGFRQYDIIAYTDWVNDANRSNDTIGVSIVNSASFTPLYRQGFEVTPYYWDVSGTNASWEVGFPSGRSISVAASGNNAYVTELDGPYNGSENAFLTSPCLDFSTALGDPTIKFSLFRDSDGRGDGMILEASTDNGLTWFKVNAGGLFQNWYNNNDALNPNFVPQWAGRSGGWVKVENVLTGLAGHAQAKLRFHFISDPNNQSYADGFGVDNIEITLPEAINAGVRKLVYPVAKFTPECGYAQESVIIDIENNGANPIDTFVVGYKVDNLPPVYDTVISTLAPNTITQYVFNERADLSANGTYFLTTWVIANGDGSGINDTIKNIQIDNNGPAVQSTPFREDFSVGFTPGSVVGNTNSIVPSSWVRSSGFTWQVANTNALLPPNTGPVTGAPGSSNGNFIYTETSGSTSGDIATLETPCIDFSNSDSVTLSFLQYRYGSGIGDLKIDVFDGLDWVEDVESISSPIQTNANSPWSKITVNLNAFAGKKIKIRFRNQSGGNNSGVLAIDNIVVYQPIPQDAEMFSINAPVSDCGLNQNSMVSVDVGNFGTQAILPNTLFVYYEIVREINNQVVRDTIKDTVDVGLAIGQRITFNFSQGADLSIPTQQYVINSWTSLAGDINNQNDSVSDYEITNFTRQPGYVEKFESFNFVDGSCLDPFSDILFNGWTVSNNNFNWNIQNARTCRGPNGATPTFNTGPEGDHSTGDGKFFYTEASLTGGVAELISPCIDFTNSSGAALAFWYHRFGSQMGKLYIDVLDDNGWTNAVDSVVGQNQTSTTEPWLLKGVNLGTFAGKLIQVRFRGIRGGERSDMAIDDIEFFNPIAQDARVSAITSPVTQCSPVDSVKVLVENFGLSAIAPSTAQVSYSVNGRAAVTETIPFGLSVGEARLYTFQTTGYFKNLNSTYNLRSWTTLPGDTNFFNDTTYYSFTNLTQGIEYEETFESFRDVGCAAAGDLYFRGWESNGWDINNVLNCGANGGPSTDATRGSGNYLRAMNHGAALYLPCVDFTNDSSAGMVFAQHITGGTLLVEVYDDLNGNWVEVYRQGPVQAFAVDPWVDASAKFEQFKGRELRIRFRALSPGHVAVDDIGFYLPQKKDARINGVLKPEAGCELFENSVVTIEVENFGTTDIPADSLDVYYQIDNQTPVGETVPTSLLVDQKLQYTFTQTADLSIIDKTYEIIAWTALRGEQNVDNDTLLNPHVVINSTKRTNYFETFETFKDASCEDMLGQVMTDGWIDKSTGGFEWHVQSSFCGKNDKVTPTENTGPNGDHTTGNGIFLYTEGTNGTAILESPCIDLQPNTNPRLNFYYHRFGGATAMGNLQVFVISNGTPTQVGSTITARPQTSEADPWSQVTYDLSAFVGNTVLIQIRSVKSGFGATCNMAIDDLSIYEQSSIDVGVTEVVSPTVDNCVVGSNIVRARIENFGSTTINAGDIIMSYSNGDTVVFDTVQQAIAPGPANSIVFSFARPYDVSVLSGIQTIKVVARLQGDTIQTNNVAAREVVNRQPGLPYYLANFEKHAMNADDNYNDDDFRGWRRTPQTGGPGTYMWHVRCGITGPYVDGQPPMPPGPPTGPSGDHTFSNTSENGKGCFMMLETDIKPEPQIPNLPADALLELPCGSIDFSNSANGQIMLSFWYHMFGPGTGDLYIEVEENGNNNWVIAGVVRGQQQFDDVERWRQRQISLNRYAGKSNLKIRFRAEWGARGGDIGIDDIEIIDRQMNDTRVSKILDPGSDCDLTTTERFRVEYQNLGLLPILESRMCYQVTFTPYKGRPQLQDIVCDTVVGIAGYVAPLAKQIFEFDRIDMSSPGRYEIKVWSNMEGDGFALNDTIIEVVENVTRPFPNCEDFSDLVLGNIPKQYREGKLPNSWEGNPSAYAFKASINGDGPTTGHTGRANDIYLLADDGDGQPGQVARIESPCYDLTNTPAAILEFWYQAPSLNHFMLVEARPVGGQWQVLDTLYGDGILGVFNWTKETIVLTDFVGDFVQVRFRGLNAGDGYYAIDDFCIKRPRPQQIQLERFAAPLNGRCFYSDAEEIVLRVQNVGLDRITNFQIVVAFDSAFQSFPLGKQLRDTFDIEINQAPFLDPGVKQDIPISALVDMSGYNSVYYFNAWVILPGDKDEENNVIRDYAVGHATPISLPYFEDFEFTCAEGPGFVPSYTNGIRSAGSGMFYFWEQWCGPLPNFRDQLTGPAVDHTKGTTQGGYMITNAQAGARGDSAILQTRCIDLTTAVSPMIRYWYYMFGFQMGDLYLDVNADAGWEQVDRLSFQDPDQYSSFRDWKSRTIDLSAYKGKVVRFRFRSYRGNGTASDMAIDDINVFDLLAKDIAPISLAEPTDDSSSCYVETQKVRVNLRNNGAQAIDFTVDTTEIKVYIFKENLLIDSLYRQVVTNEWENQSGQKLPLPQDSIVSITLDDDFDMTDTGKVYRFEVYVEMKGDQGARNDQISISVLSQIKSGRAVVVTPNDTICSGDAVTIHLRDHFGKIDWFEIAHDENGPTGPQPASGALANEGRTFIGLPDSTTDFYAGICIVETINRQSNQLRIEVIKPPAPTVIFNDSCESFDGSPRPIPVTGNVKEIDPPITRVRILGPNPGDRDSLNIPSGVNGRFTYRGSTNMTDTLYVKSIVRTPHVRYKAPTDPINQVCVSRDSSLVERRVNPRAVINLVGPIGDTICQDSTMILNAGSVPNRSDSYEWTIIMPDGRLIVGEDSVTMLGQKPLTKQTLVIDAWKLDLNKRYGYTVKVTTDSNCVTPDIDRGQLGDTVYFVVSDSCITGLNKLAFSERFEIYPNPVSQELFITHTANSTLGEGVIRILTVEGQLVKSFENVPFSGLNKRIDMGDLPKGIYIIKIDSEEGSLVRKIIKS
jgi:hypothetical protein